MNFLLFCVCHTDPSPRAYLLIISGKHFSFFTAKCKKLQKLYTNGFCDFVLCSLKNKRKFVFRIMHHLPV